MNDEHFKHEALAILARIERRLIGENIQGEVIMSQLEDLTTALNNETNVLAAKLTSLQTSLATALANNQAPSDADIAALKAVSDRLTALGADPSNPIPPATVPAAAPTTPAAT